MRAVDFLADLLAEPTFDVDGHWRPQQVQHFTPTPMTLATDMYYSGYHPMSGKPVYVPKTLREKKMQKALLQAHDPANRELVREARRSAGLNPEPPRPKGPPRRAAPPSKKPGGHHRPTGPRQGR